MDGVLSCCLRGGSVSHCVPGMSDLDMAVFIEELPIQQHTKLLLELRKRWHQLRHTYLIPGELVVLDPPRLAWMRKHRPPLLESFQQTRSYEKHGVVTFDRPNAYAKLCLAYEYTVRYLQILDAKPVSFYSKVLASKFRRKAEENLGCLNVTDATLLSTLSNALSVFTPSCSIDVEVKIRRGNGKLSLPKSIEDDPILRDRYFGLYGTESLISKLGKASRQIDRIALQHWCSRALTETFIDQYIRLPSLVVNETPESLNMHLRGFSMTTCALGLRLLSDDADLILYYSQPVLPTTVRFYQNTTAPQTVDAKLIARTHEMSETGLVEVGLPELKDTTPLSLH